MALVTALFVAAISTASAAGLDGTFGGDGVVATPVDTVSGASAVLLQPDGKGSVGGPSTLALKAPGTNLPMPPLPLPLPARAQLQATNRCSAISRSARSRT